jgi:CheY-like chemotaxis protein
LGDRGESARCRNELHGEVDLIVSNIQMPNRDGTSFARAVKNAHPVVPIILISGRAKPDAAFQFVENSFSPAALVKAVQDVLARKPRIVRAD